MSELEPAIRVLAGKVWKAVARSERVPRTIVLKLKTSDFRILTRSLTPGRWPESADEFADIACQLRERVALPDSTRYRLAGVGLSNFEDVPQAEAQADLFGPD